MSTLQEVVADADFDVALVAYGSRPFAAAQAARRQGFDGTAGSWLDLTQGQRRKAEELAAVAREGNLVLLIGSGISRGAGLPGWEDLLEQLAAEAALDEQARHALKLVPLVDRAVVLERRFAAQGRRLSEEIRRIFSGKEHHSLAHGLLASLPIKEAVTLNYDHLFELANEGACQKLDILPYRRGFSNRWLLKLHGDVDHPEDIVLSRDDYLRFSERRSALAGIVQALLITRHMLFVGFSLTDDNFYGIVHEVRKALTNPGAMEEERRSLGTALLLEEHEYAADLWDDIDLVQMSADDARESSEASDGLRERARRLEIFLDYLSFNATTSVPYLLDDSYKDLLSDEEKGAADWLRKGLEGTFDLGESPLAETLSRLAEEFGKQGQPE